MRLELVEAPITSVHDLAEVSISFSVDHIFDITLSIDRPGEFRYSEHKIDVPFVKDYDQVKGEGPTAWAKCFDISNWGFIRAQSAGKLVGGTVIAFKTANATMLEGRTDLAVIWDIRVSPQHRGTGIGSALLRAAEAWAGSRDCRELKVETQNINVTACRFYERHGFVLKSVDRFAYAAYPAEIQMLWYKKMSNMEYRRRFGQK